MYVWTMRVNVEWRGGVAQGELVKKLAQDWSKRKKLTTAAVYADHFAVSCLVFLFEYSRFLNIYKTIFELLLMLLGGGLTQYIPIYTQTARFTKKGPNLDGVRSFGCKAHDRGLRGWETDWIPTAQVNKGLGSEPPVFPRIHKGY